MSTSWPFCFRLGPRLGGSQGNVYATSLHYRALGGIQTYLGGSYCTLGPGVVRTYVWDHVQIHGGHAQSPECPVCPPTPRVDARTSTQIRRTQSLCRSLAVQQVIKCEHRRTRGCTKVLVHEKRRLRTWSVAAQACRVDVCSCKISMTHVGRGVAAKRTNGGGEVYEHGAAAADVLRERGEQSSPCLAPGSPVSRAGADLRNTLCSSAKIF